MDRPRASVKARAPPSGEPPKITSSLKFLGRLERIAATHLPCQNQRLAERGPRETRTMSGDLLMQFASAIADGSVKVIDLTQTLRPSTPVIQLPPPFAPSDPFSISVISNYDERGPAWYWNNLKLGEHTGTHFDAPIHWVTGKDYADGATDTIPGQALHRAGGGDRLLEGSGGRREIRLRAGAYRGLRGEARPHPRRRLGADADRLVEAHRPGRLPEHEGGRPARAGAERGLREVPGRAAQRQRLGRRGGRHRCRPGLRLRAGLSRPIT